jgi:alanine-glyoxylate transaminase/serine-glyoxylate transaminase/serine-pyruvate transaminase
VHLLLALRQAIDMLYEEGLENVFATACFKAVRRAVAKMGRGPVLGFNVSKLASEPTR